ncbi:hypothetical protein HMPREF9628_01959, partial [Peptoanaerobacter stomatis]
RSNRAKRRPNILEPSKKVIDRIIEKQDSQVDISAGATIYK